MTAGQRAHWQTWKLPHHQLRARRPEAVARLPSPDSKTGSLSLLSVRTVKKTRAQLSWGPRTRLSAIQKVMEIRKAFERLTRCWSGFRVSKFLLVVPGHGHQLPFLQIHLQVRVLAS